jgi:hypothetical protein
MADYTTRFIDMALFKKLVMILIITCNKMG